MQVEIFVEMFEMEIVQQMGRSGTRLVDVRYRVLYSLGQEKSQHASSHIDRFDSPVGVRYLVSVASINCAISEPLLYHNPSKADVRPPNISKRKVRKERVAFFGNGRWTDYDKS